MKVPCGNQTCQYWIEGKGIMHPQNLTVHFWDLILILSKFEQEMMQSTAHITHIPGKMWFSTAFPTSCLPVFSGFNGARLTAMFLAAASNNVWFFLSSVLPGSLLSLPPSTSDLENLFRMKIDQFWLQNPASLSPARDGKLLMLRRACDNRRNLSSMGGVW